MDYWISSFSVFCCQFHLYVILSPDVLYSDVHFSGNGGISTTTPTASKVIETPKYLPPTIPSIPIDEIKEITDSFGTTTLIGEGSYGRVYHGVLKNGRTTAIKKLDSSKQPDQELLSQVDFVLIRLFLFYSSFFLI